MKIEVVLTSHDAWWLRFINWLGADMEWGHALLRFRPANAPSYIIEAMGEGVIKRPWRTNGWQRYGRFRLKEPSQDTALVMTAFAEGEVGKRYRYEALPIIARKILKRIIKEVAEVIERIVKKITGKKYSVLYIGKGEVCTSLVDNVFGYVGYDLVPDEVSPFVLPDDIADSELLERIEDDR